MLLCVFFPYFGVLVLRDTLCKSLKVTHFTFRQLTPEKFQFHFECFHCCKHLKYKLIFSVKLNVEIIQVCCNITKEKETMIAGLILKLLKFSWLLFL
jgi:hypothetical protein